MQLTKLTISNGDALKTDVRQVVNEPGVHRIRAIAWP